MDLKKTEACSEGLLNEVTWVRAGQKILHLTPGSLMILKSECMEKMEGEIWTPAPF